MSKDKKHYGNESISSLKGADRVRKRPGVIFGSDGIDGCQHAVFEILSNSIDEAREGYGTVIEVTYFRDNAIQVCDYGRGIPLDYNEKEERYNWELVFCELYAGGKYGNLEGDNYEYSLGLNGLGACATQYSSEYMDVSVARDGFRHTLHFEKGENVGGLQKEPTNKRATGSTIKWRPDLDVFTQIEIPLDYFQNILKKQAVVNAGVKFILKYEQKDAETGKYAWLEFEFLYQNGIVDYVREVDNGKGLTDVQYYEHERKGRDREDKPEYKVKMQVAFCFNNENNLIEYYHNSSFLEHGGSPDKAVKTAFVAEIDQYLKNNNKYTKAESKILFGDIQDSLILVTNSFSTVTSYENQTKKAINNKFIQEALTEFLKEKLEIFMIENKMQADKIADQILVNKRSRETAEKARINIKKKLTGNMDMTTRVQKYVDCRSKDMNKREIYIVEGDSALGACKLGRDAEFQAIIPVRGKILNCLKADYDKIFRSDIIVDLLKVLGCGVEIKTKHNKDFHSFDYNNFKWGKIVICTDADVDGYQIRTLILTMLYTLVPTLIEKGRVYIAESPLFEITCKGKSYFAYDEREKITILSQLKDKYTLQRSKGLGENEPEMMWLTTMNPETRRLIQVIPEDVLRTQEVFDLLLGDNLQGRKDFIAEHGYRYLDLTDLG
ncbi:MAG: DNA topoisomerase [Hyphomonadaceae bacterium]|nr:DNA topoisomerase [Clostridia bacterium]